MIRMLNRLVTDPGQRRDYLGTALLAAIVRGGTVLLLFPLLSALFSDAPSRALPWMAALAGAVVAGWFIDRRLSLAGFDIGFTMLTSIETRVLARVEQLPTTWMTPERRGTVAKALTSAGHELCTGVAYLLTPALAAIGSTPLIGAGLLWVNVPLGVVTLLGIPVLVGAQWISGRLIRRAEMAYAESSTRAARSIEELARQQRLLRSHGRATTADGPIGAVLRTQRTAARRLVGWTVPGQVLFGLAAQGLLVLLAGVAAWQGVQGELSGAEVVAVIVVITRLHEPFTSFVALGPAMEGLRGSLRRVEEVLSARPLAEPEVSAVPSHAPHAVELRGVRFRHDPAGPLVLDDVSLAVPPGTTTAIVGPSGSGKSTLLSLLVRAADVEAGQVVVRGHDVRDYRLDVLMAQFGIVLQDVYLVDGTLRDNVLLGNAGASDAVVADAARAAQLDEVIARLPDGWETRVGEAGDLLSGGEKQRVSIARALARRAPLLLLDEASSSLDTHNERAVVEALEASAGERTTLVVAHRLETIARADQIVFLEGGRIVEQGTFTELLALDGRFATYWQARRTAGSWALR